MIRIAPANPTKNDGGRRRIERNKGQNDCNVQFCGAMCEVPTNLLRRHAMVIPNYVEQTRHALISRKPVLGPTLEVTGVRSATRIGVANSQILRAFCVP